MISNCLTSIPEEMERMTSLKELNLSDNRISEINCSFQKLTNLESFHVVNNEISVCSPLEKQRNIVPRKYRQVYNFVCD